MFKLAADQGHAEALYNLGVMYAKGQGVVQNYKKASGKLAETRDMLGRSLALFDVCQRPRRSEEFKEAFKWYKLAANQGHAGAQTNLGAMYAKGRGVAQDYKEAFKWYKLAADQGHAGAQFGLGLMYAKGQGVVQLQEGIQVV